MIQKISIKDYKKEIQEEKYENIYRDLIGKSMELVKEIGKIKKFEFPEDEEGRTLFCSIQIYFKKNFGEFSNVYYLMKDLSEWNCEDNYVYDTYEKKINNIIVKYNNLIVELEIYRKIEEEIKEKKFEKVLEEQEEKCRKLFKEMLEYKNKEYNEKWDMIELIEKVIQYYNFYYDELRELKQVMSGNFIEFDIEEELVEIDNIERIMLIDEIYRLIVDEDYKKVAYMYRDFELKDGQTYSDLYDLEYKKLDELYKKMLEFVGEENLKNEKNLEGRMLERYPFYILDIKRINSYEPCSVIERLNTMENIYEKLSKDYKNYEENMKKYEKFQNMTDENEEELEELEETMDELF